MTIFSIFEQKMMQRALVLAVRGLHTAWPNPRVGCVVVQGEIIVGEGWHECVGGLHAEAEALARAGDEARGATVFVTLEPCDHHGRVPPCTEALIQAGVARVIIASIDHHFSPGAGVHRLRAHGIRVSVGLCVEQARELNVGFFSCCERGRPWVRVKVAQSVDGYSALSNGVSQWITSTEARADGHRWRARADTIAVGSGTVVQDDPCLTVRGWYVRCQPCCVVFDSRLVISASARLFNAIRPVVIFCVPQSAANYQPFMDKGAEVIVTPAVGGRVDLRYALEILAKREQHEMHVEAGPTLAGALLAAGVVDELLVYIGGCLLGRGAQPSLGLTEDWHTLNQVPSLHLIHCQCLQQDVCLHYRTAVGAAFLSGDDSGWASRNDE